MLSVAFLAAPAITLPATGWSASTHAALQALIDRPVSSTLGRSPVAAFDADGTLWSGDAYGAFSSVLVREHLIDGSAAAHIEHEYSRSEAQVRKRWLLESLTLFGGLRLEQMQAAAEEAWVSCGGPGESRGLRDTLRPEMANLVRCLRQAGWRVLMVTASPAEAVLRGAQELGIPEGDVFAIRLETDAGTVTGRPSAVMPLTWREGKARALEAHGLTERLADDQAVPGQRRCRHDLRPAPDGCRRSVDRCRGGKEAARGARSAAGAAGARGDRRGSGVRLVGRRVDSVIHLLVTSCTMTI